MKNIKRFIAVMFSCLLGLNSSAQINLEEDLRKEFNSFSKESRKSFDDFVTANDNEFSEHLRNAWEELESNGIDTPPKDPKPQAMPQINASIEEVESVALSAKVAGSDNEGDNDDENYNQEQIKYKAEKENFSSNYLGFSFFGASAETTYDKSFIKVVRKPVTNKVIADYWDEMAKTNHYTFIKQLQDTKEKMQLNDWGYYELVYKAAKDICTTDDDAAKLLTWFILVKSHYRAKVGFSPDGAHLLLNFSNKIFGKPYFRIAGKRYYVLENVSRLSTYKDNYNVATNNIKLTVDKPLKIGKEVKTRDLSFKHNSKKYNFTISYVKNDISFYESYPQADVKIYFDAAVSDVARHSLLSQLEPIISPMSQVEASNFLLSFVQKAFPYKTDPEQFGREKFFFAEEIFFYPYSDCEDRSVLYGFLVRELLHLEVIGLKYPGHMATAVAFTEPIDQHHLYYAGKKFTVCDPTYVNATSGMCMPQFISSNAFIVPVK